MSNPFETVDPLKKHAGDVDLSWDSLHHTLGAGPTQAAAGKHKHDAKDILGVVEVSLESGVNITDATGSITTAFPRVFPNVPVVVATVLGQNAFMRINSNPSVSQFNATAIDVNGNVVPNCYFYWLAAPYTVVGTMLTLPEEDEDAEE